MKRIYTFYLIVALASAALVLFGYSEHGTPECKLITLEKNELLYSRLPEVLLSSKLSMYAYSTVDSDYQNWDENLKEICAHYGDCFVRQSKLGARALVLHDYGNNQLYVAFKGTSSWDEIKVDLGQMFGFSVYADAYYEEASQLLDNIIRERASENLNELIITGHSLGGALGVYSSLELGINDGGYDFNSSIFTFNSAVLHMNNYFFRSFSGIVQERDVENIINIVAIDDFVPLFKGVRSFMGLQGYTYALSAPNSFHNPLWNHGIEELIGRIKSIKSERNFCDCFIGFSYIAPQYKT